MSVVSESLHDVPGNACVRIRTILFDQIREACARQGVHAGQTVRVRRSGHALWLELAPGRTVALGAEWARFIEVEPGGPSLRRRAPARRRPWRRP
mgnify:CR=1 FL=1